MSYQEKKTITSIISSVLILAVYWIYLYIKYQSGTTSMVDLKFWAGTILTFIGVGIVATIVIQIVFHIIFSIAIAVKENKCNNKDDKVVRKTIEASMVEDEMDKLIGLKSSRIGFAFAGIGFIIALVSLVLNYPPSVMINILFMSWIFGWMFEDLIRLKYYRNGVENG